MQRLSSFQRLVDAVAIFVGLYFCKYVNNYFESKQVPYAITFLLCIVLLLVLIKVLGWLCSFLINNSILVRSMILREENIEGIWFSTVNLADCSYYGLLLIAVRKGEIHVSGEQFNKDGNIRVSWTTIMSKFNGHTLKYVYQSIYAEAKKVEEVYGISTHDFVRISGNKRPGSFNGDFVELSSTFERQTFIGRRVTDKKVLRLLEDPSRKHEGLKALMGA